MCVKQNIIAGQVNACLCSPKLPPPAVERTQSPATEPVQVGVTNGTLGIGVLSIYYTNTSANAGHQCQALELVMLPPSLPFSHECV